MTEMTKSMAVFTGSVNPSLADQVATELGTTLGNVKLEKFANGEIYARYLDSVRGADRRRAHQRCAHGNAHHD